MPGDWRALIAAFDVEVAALLEAIDELADDDFARPTNCPPWDLRELVVHIAFSACVSADPRSARPPGDVVTTAADYYRRAERETDEYRTRNVDQTRLAAARFAMPAAAIARLRDGWETSKLGLEAADPAGHVGGARPGTRMSVFEYTVTRLIALVAHGFDVAITLDLEPWTSPAALAEVMPALRELLGDEHAYDTLALDDLDFVMVATGRRRLTGEESARLGPDVADRIPLLS
jgi:uncharacterized protein (TIGR03083 family)